MAKDYFYFYIFFLSYRVKEKKFKKKALDILAQLSTLFSG